MGGQLYGNLNTTTSYVQVKKIRNTVFFNRQNITANFLASFFLLGAAFSLKFVISSFICHFNNTSGRPITAWPIGGKQFWIITFVIILMPNILRWWKNHKMFWNSARERFSLGSFSILIKDNFLHRFLKYQWVNYHYISILPKQVQFKIWQTRQKLLPKLVYKQFKKNCLNLIGHGNYTINMLFWAFFWLFSSSKKRVLRFVNSFQYDWFLEVNTHWLQCQVKLSLDSEQIREIRIETYLNQTVVGRKIEWLYYTCISCQFSVSSFRTLAVCRGVDGTSVYAYRKKYIQYIHT